MFELTPIIVPILSFAAVAAIVLVAGRYYTVQLRMQQRLPTRAVAVDLAGEPLPHGIHAFIAQNFDERRFGIDAARRERLRGDLLKAGYFGRYSLNYYVLARISCALGFPVLAYILTQSFSAGIPPVVKLLVVLIAGLVGFAGPDAYLAAASVGWPAAIGRPSRTCSTCWSCVSTPA
jgi:tight adherence protein C